jgi:predicted nucleic acid-binding Zn ribbon protein
MRVNPKEEEKPCKNCGKALFGRTDKRFCNDTCRNAFNRNKSLREHQAVHENLPEIFKIIKRNYELLKALGPPASDTQVWIRNGYPEDEGINPKFFTSVYQEGDILWRFCFDYGWRIYEGGGWNIYRQSAQADITCR